MRISSTCSVLGQRMVVLQETADEGVELKIEEKDSKCRKNLSSVTSAMRSSFRKFGFRRLVGPVHEGFHMAGDESPRDLEIFWRCEDSYNRIFYRRLQMKVWRLRLRKRILNVGRFSQV